MFNKIKEKKGGFTLVELIIVLVILAILAAFLVPTLTGYVDRANDKTLIAETRVVVMAAQTITDEVYANGEKPEFGDDKTVTAADILKLAEVDGTITALTFDTDDTAVITELKYEDAGNNECVYKDGKYEVTP